MEALGCVVVLLTNWKNIVFDQQVTFLYASDLEVSADFYENQLGLKQVLDQGQCRIFQVSKDGFLGVCQGEDGAEPARDGVIVTLVTEDVDGWYERLTAMGMSIEAEPTLNPTFNIYHFFLRDPDGYLLEVQRFCDPAWPSPTESASG